MGKYNSAENQRFYTQLSHSAKVFSSEIYTYFNSYNDKRKLKMGQSMQTLADKEFSGTYVR